MDSISKIRAIAAWGVHQNATPRKGSFHYLPGVAVVEAPDLRIGCGRCEVRSILSSPSPPGLDVDVSDPTNVLTSLWPQQRYIYHIFGRRKVLCKSRMKVFPRPLTGVNR
jgi:hypothetical protein